MDALENGDVFVIGATNRVDDLDPAVRRPGRFDKHLLFGFPDEEARKKILEIHTQSWEEQERPDQETYEKIARRTLGFSGADLQKLCADVVYKAIEANGGVLDSNVKVTENHWYQAISEMQRTASNSFGSSLFIPVKPNPVVSRLIDPVVQQAMEKIRPFLTAQSLQHSSPTFSKNLLLFITPDQSKSFLNNHILQGLLSEPEFNKISIFELSPTSITGKILAQHKSTVLGVVNDVVNQALDARTENPSCLVVTAVDEILGMGASPVPSKLILQSLARVCGPKMLLLATCSVPPDQIKDQRVVELFSCGQWMAVKNPDAAQLQQLFREMLIDHRGKEWAHNRNVTTILEQTAMKAARSAYGDNHEHILELYGALSKVEIGEDAAELGRAFNEILDEYQRTKLRSI